MALADKIAALLDRRKPDGTRYTMEEVITGTGGKVSRAYLWKLKTGQATNPSLDVLEALAKFFNVPLDYFSARTGPLPQLAVPQVVNEIALRASTLTEEGQKAVLSMVLFAAKAGQNQSGGADKGTPSGEGG